MNLVQASEKQIDELFMAVFNHWNEGLSQVDYLKKGHQILKNRNGQWWYLENQGARLSSMVVFRFSNDLIGLGWINTPENLQGKGYAGKLIDLVIHKFKQLNPAVSFILYSEINPDYYQKFGFEPLEEHFQTDLGRSVCMVKGSVPFKSKEEVPEYF